MAINYDFLQQDIIIEEAFSKYLQHCILIFPLEYF